MFLVIYIYKSLFIANAKTNVEIWKLKLKIINLKG